MKLRDQAEHSLLHTANTHTGTETVLTQNLLQVTKSFVILIFISNIPQAFTTV